MKSYPVISLVLSIALAPFLFSQNLLSTLKRFNLSSKQFTGVKGIKTDRFAKLGFRQEEISSNSLR